MNITFATSSISTNRVALSPSAHRVVSSLTAAGFTLDGPPGSPHPVPLVGDRVLCRLPSGIVTTPTRPEGRGGRIPAAMQHPVGVTDNATSGSMFAAYYETTPELMFPWNLEVYDRMRRTDGQVRSLLRAVTGPALAARTRLDGSDVDPAVMNLCEAELGLVADDKGRRRTRDGGLSWDSFIRHAMLHLPLGFTPFEQTYMPGLAETEGLSAGRPVAHLDLDVRMPRSVIRFDLTEDGKLAQLVQAPYVPYGVQVPKTGGRQPGTEIPIPADRLVMFINEQEGSDYGGQSILRSAYKHWLIKDTLIRIGALSADRQGMGVPVVNYLSDEGQRDPVAERVALDIASRVRAGEDTGVALPTGWTMTILGVTGSVAETLEWVKYHDQATSRSMLAMFMDLGYSAGLGSGQNADTFVEFFLASETQVFRYVEEVVTEQIIRRLVALNFDADTTYPALVIDDPQPESKPTIGALAELTKAGLLIPDEALRTELRRRWKMPAETAGAQTPADGGPAVDDGEPGDQPLPAQPAGGGGQAAPLSPLADMPVGSDGVGPGGIRVFPSAVAASDREGTRLTAGDRVGVWDDGRVVPGRFTTADGDGLVVTLADGTVRTVPAGLVLAAEVEGPPSGVTALAERLERLVPQIAALTAC